MVINLTKDNRCNCEFSDFVNFTSNNICPKCGGKILKIKETLEDRLNKCINELKDNGTLDGVKVSDRDFIQLQMEWVRDGIT